MANERAKTAKKEPGRIRQMIQIYRTTRVHDRSLTPALLLCLLGALALSFLAAWLLDTGVLGWVLWPVTGLLVGLLLAMIVLGRRAERVAYRQIEGRPGAVGAVISGALRRSWRGSETPVALTRQQDAVYRVVGRGGVVLISEGSEQRTTRLVGEEERKVKRVLPNVAVSRLHVGPDGGLELHRVSRALVKLKPSLSRQEVVAVHNRLSSLKAAPVGIPKGIDPTRMRAPRPR